MEPKITKEILPEREVKQLPYYPNLVRIIEAFKRHFIFFPYALCSPTTRVVFLKTGLEELAGECSLAEEQAGFHAWNYDDERKLYVDLSLRQYSRSFPNIVALPHTTQLLTVKQLKTELQRKVLIRGLDFIFSSKISKVLQDCGS